MMIIGVKNLKNKKSTSSLNPKKVEVFYFGNVAEMDQRKSEKLKREDRYFSLPHK